jgi:lysozyme
MGNLAAFLAMIRTSEGTDKAPDPYAVVFGYGFTITDFSNHPAITGAWPGAHYTAPNGNQILTTAAGAYQINRPTWIMCEAALHLPDFSPASQDAAAAYLVQKDGAMPYIDSGQLALAVSACRGTWASLPGSDSGQPQATLAALREAYSQAGGTLA